MIISGPTATPDAIYGPARGLRLTSDERSMLDDLVAHYGEHSSQVLRIALRHLYDSVTANENIAPPVPAVS